MRTSPLPEFQAEATLTDTPFPPIEAALRDLAARRGLDLHEGHGRSIWCELPVGEFGAKKRGEGTLLFARAHRAQDLAALQSEIAALSAEAPAWSSGLDAGRFPPNFSLARVHSVTRIGESFVRLRLESEGLERLSHDDSIHFRLVLQPSGTSEPVWPSIGANGQTQWPSGGQALHRPPYTTRAVDVAAGWVDTDIFLHEGGRITDWVLAAKAGERIGLAGPGGSGIPEATRLFLAGDETAYPALARMIEARPDARGHLWLLGKSADYPMPQAEGITTSHLPQDTPALLQALRLIAATQGPFDDSFFWMAAERGAVSQLRGLLLDELGIDSKATHLSAYWSDPHSPAERPARRSGGRVSRPDQSTNPSPRSAALATGGDRTGG